MIKISWIRWHSFNSSCFINCSSTNCCGCKFSYSNSADSCIWNYGRAMRWHFKEFPAIQISFYYSIVNIVLPTLHYYHHPHHLHSTCESSTQHFPPPQHFHPSWCCPRCWCWWWRVTLALSSLLEWVRLVGNVCL